MHYLIYGSESSKITTEGECAVARSSRAGQYGVAFALALALAFVVSFLAAQSARAEAGVVYLSLETAEPAPAPSADAGSGLNTANARSPGANARRGGVGSGCADGSSCFWPNNDYVGSFKVIADCGEFGGNGWFFIHSGAIFNSAKNRCNNRRLRTGNEFVGTACMNAGGERPNLADSDRFNIGVLNSDCSN